MFVGDDDSHAAAVVPSAVLTVRRTVIHSRIARFASHSVPSQRQPYRPVKSHRSIINPRSHERGSVCRKTIINHLAPISAPFLFFRRQVRRKNSLVAKTAFLAVFKGTGVVLAGIECRPKIFDFRASGIPVQERGDFVDTLKRYEEILIPFHRFICCFAIRY